MALGIIVRSPYTPYSIYLRGTIGVQGLGGEDLELPV